MQIRLREKQTLQIDASGNVTGARLIYHCNGLGSSTTLQILGEVKSAAEVISGASIDTVEVVKLPDADCCDVAVNYRDAARQGDTQFSRRKRQPGDELWSFDLSGGTAVVRRAVAQLSDQGDPLLTENVADYVGWNGKFGEAFQCAGVNIITPSMRETCRLTVSATTVDSTFRRTLGELCGKVNTSAFHGWNAGEVLFAGASLSAPYYNDDGANLVDVTYNFNIRANEASVTIGNYSLSDVNGWDYAWGITGFDPSTQKNAVLAVFVSQVYDYADLNDLGVGGGGDTPGPDPEPEA